MMKFQELNNFNLPYRCLAHVINLVTQAVIANSSKTKHFDPEKPDDHEPDVNAITHDEVGLVWSITVKVALCFLRSSHL